MKKYKILHITPHLGGGVGSVLTKYLKHKNSNVRHTHTLFSLEYINAYAQDILINNGIPYKENLAKNYKKILKAIPNFDIILIHWWNHPLLYEFLTKFTLPKCRVIMWSHISGLFSPSNFTKPLFKYADKFVFTTPISYEVDIIKNLTPKYKQKLSTIWSTGGLKHLEKVRYKQHKGFNVGYIGTVDYSKLHKDFLEMSNAVDIDNIKFIICGGDNEQQIKQEAIKKGIDAKFTFTGKVLNVAEYLCQFDVFGYPLSPYHFGTCDQVLQEAMACGVVPIVFNNPMENSIVNHLQTGIIVANKRDYTDAIKLLHQDSQLRKKLSDNAKQFAHDNFSLEKMIEQWEKIFDEISSIRPSKKTWNSADGVCGVCKDENLSALQIFLESTGENKKYFKKLLMSEVQQRSKILKTIQNKIHFREVWQSATKGTLNHYCTIFRDEELNQLKALLNKIM